MLSTKEERKLYDDMVSFYGSLFRLPPLNSKVYVYLMFDFEYQGVTFNELIDRFQVSKSSLSNALQMLIQHKFVEYTTPIHSRKRRYRINSKFLEYRLKTVMENLRTERELMLRMIDCSKKKKKLNNVVTKPIGKYVTVLDTHIKTFQGTLKIISSLNK